MDGSSVDVRRSLRLFLLCGLCAIGSLALAPAVHGQGSGSSTGTEPKAAPIPDPPPTPPPVKTDYSLDSKTPAISFQYTTCRDKSTGVVSLASAGPPSKLTVAYNDGSGNLPTNLIILVVQFTYEGKPAKFSTDPTAADAGKNTYAVDLSKVATAVVTMINNRIPPGFDPDNRNDSKFTLTDVKFSVIAVPPMVPVGGKPAANSTPVPVDNGAAKPAITVDEVFGEQQ